METRKIVRAIVYDIVDTKKIYLLLKAKKGYWQNPQGGIDFGESESEAILREIKEETNLDDCHIDLTTRGYDEYDTIRKEKTIHTTVATYAVKVNSSQTIKLSVEDGHTEYRWVTYDEALNMLNKFPEQKIIFEKIVDKIK